MNFQPGIHLGIPYEEYSAVDAIRCSHLKWGQSTAAHLQAAMNGKMKPKETADTLFGRALHARLLEPDIYIKEYTVAGLCATELKTGVRKGMKCEGEGKYQNEDGRWFCSTHVPKMASDGKKVSLLDPVPNLLTAAQAKNVSQAAQHVEGDEVVRLLRQRGAFEATLMFTIDDMGLQDFPLNCKVRLDKLVAPVTDGDGKELWPPTIIDLKKVGLGKADQYEVEWSIERWNYDAAAAFYVDALKRVTGQTARFIWVFVEDEYPFAINVMECDEETLAIGRVRYTEWLGKYAVGMQTGVWPGYYIGTQINRGGLPKKIRDQFYGRQR